VYSTLNSIPAHILQFISRLIPREGGYSERKGDRGGPTNMGITLLTLKRWSPDATKDDLKNLTQFEATLIYANLFWDSNFEELSRISMTVAEQTFDFGVNSGPQTAIKQLQKLISCKPDGIVGPVTTGALIRYLDKNGPRNTVHFYCDQRMRYLIDVCQNDYGQIVNLEGWFNRVTALRYSAI